MSFKIIVPRSKNDIESFNKFVLPSLKRFNLVPDEIIDDDPNISESIFKKYNLAIQTLKDSELKDEDIVVFMHSDTGILDDNFTLKLEHLFKTKPEIGIVGVAGTTELFEGGWWMNKDQSKLRGHLLQGKEEEGQAYYLQKGPVGYFDNIVAVDGCIMATTIKVLRDSGIMFDNDIFKDDNDFYDLDICLQLLEKGYKIAIADFFVFHKSVGKGCLKQSWYNAKDKFVSKWKNKGITFPVTEYTFNKNNNIVKVDV